MSASQNKKKRQENRGEELEKLSAEQAAARKKKSLKRARNVVIAIVVVCVIAAIFVINSNLFYTGMAAVDIDGTQYTAAEVNYIYRSTYYNFLNQQESSASSLGMSGTDYLNMLRLDTRKPLDEQPYYIDASITWHDYFLGQAMDSLKEITAMSKAAQAAGFVLSQEDQDAVEQNVQYLSVYASVNGFASVKQYLASQYGKGVTEDTVRKMMTLGTTAARYEDQVRADFSYEDEALDAWYQEHRDEYDVVSYLQYFFPGSVEDVEEPTEAQKDEAMAQAKKKADAMAAEAKDEESFLKLTLEYAAETASSGTTGRAQSMGRNLSGEYSQWLLDAERRDNDVEVIEAAGGYHVVMFLSREDNSYALRQVRHILVKAQADADGSYTDEAKAAAKEQAEALLKEWKDGEATEESFAEMANQFSEDAGSNTTGGLYDQVMKGAYVPEFEDFAFAPGRKTGDTGVIFGETPGQTGYCGYHAMYYVGEGQLYSRYIADSMLRNDDFTAWKTQLLDGVRHTANKGFRFIG